MGIRSGLIEKLHSLLFQHTLLCIFTYSTFPDMNGAQLLFAAADLKPLLSIGYILFVMVTIAVIIHDKRDPVKALSWIIVISLLPVVGFVLYIVFGRNHRKQKDIQPQRAPRPRADRRPQPATDLRNQQRCNLPQNRDLGQPRHHYPAASTATKALLTIGTTRWQSSTTAKRPSPKFAVHCSMQDPRFTWSTTLLKTTPWDGKLRHSDRQGAIRSRGSRHI